MVLHELGTEQGVLTIQEYLLPSYLQSLTVHSHVLGNLHIKATLMPQPGVEVCIHVLRNLHIKATLVPQPGVEVRIHVLGKLCIKARFDGFPLCYSCMYVRTYMLK